MDLFKVTVILATYVCFCKGQKEECTDWSCDFGAACLMTSSNVKKCVCPDTMPCEDSERNMTLCGADGVSYANVCEVRRLMCQRQAPIEVQHFGACGVERCTSRWDCFFEGECLGGECVCVPCRDIIDRRVYYAGEYANTEGARRALQHTSVCGSDGITYESECHLRYHSCVGRSVVTVAKLGICRDEGPSDNLAEIFSPSVNIVQRSVIQRRIQNCSQIRFSHCVSKNHPRLKYMGTFDLMSGKEHEGSPVYKLRSEGSVGYTSSKSLEIQDDAVPAYLSRYVSQRHPKGVWVVGSRIGSGKGWLGSYDSASLPQDIRRSWKSTTRGKNKDWSKEPTLSLQCSSNIKNNFECEEAYVFHEPKISNWQRVSPRTPIYVLKVRQSIRNRRKKRTRKIKVEITTKRKTKRFVAYILKLSNDRESCGLPSLAVKRNGGQYIEKCGGSVIMNDVSGRKMMKTKIRFTAPEYGCIDISATILSHQGKVYQDDSLVKRICSDDL